MAKEAVQRTIWRQGVHQR